MHPVYGLPLFTTGFPIGSAVSQRMLSRFEDLWIRGFALPNPLHPYGSQLASAEDFHPNS